MSLQESHSPDLQRKIELGIASKNIGELKRIGQQFGFLNEENRKLIWPLLLGVNQQNNEASPDNSNSYNNSKQSKFFDQLKKDTDRSISGLDSFQNESESIIKAKQDELLELLDRIMKEQPELQYYQGYNDVALIFLLLFGVEEGFQMSKQAANTFFRDPLMHTLDQSGILMMQITQKIVYKECPVLQDILEEVGGVSFSLGWILTWFSHSFSNISYSQRIFDFLLCSKPETIAYLSAAFVLVSFEQIQDRIHNSGDQTPMEVVFSFYQNIAQVAVDFSKWFNLCDALQDKFPFSQFFKEFPFPKDSNLIEEVFQMLLQGQQPIKQYEVLNTGMFGKMKNIISFKNTAYVLIGVAVAYQATKYVNIKILKAIGSGIAAALPLGINSNSLKSSTTNMVNQSAL